MITEATNTNTSQDFYHDASVMSVKDDLVGYSLVVGAALCLTFRIFTVNKKLCDVSCMYVNFWISSFGIVISALGMVIFEKPTLPCSTVCSFLLIGHCLAIAAANISTTFSQQVFAPMIFSLAMLMTAVLSFIAQYTVMKSTNPGKQNAAEITGAVVIVVGNVITPVYKLYLHCVR
jgi:glucose uptake protein GlcU